LSKAPPQRSSIHQGECRSIGPPERTRLSSRRHRDQVSTRCVNTDTAQIRSKVAGGCGSGGSAAFVKTWNGGPIASVIHPPRGSPAPSADTELVWPHKMGAYR